MTFSYDDISGTLINYFGHCKRQAWLFNTGIRMEDNSDAVKMGKYIDQRRFSRNNEVEISGERMKVDFVEKDKSPIVIHEVKASVKAREEHKLQIGFYLERLKAIGVDAIGVIHYPEIRDKVTVNLEEIEDVIKKTYADIIDTMNDTCPPRLPKKSCKGCSYYPFCFSIEDD